MQRSFFVAVIANCSEEVATENSIIIMCPSYLKQKKKKIICV